MENNTYENYKSSLTYLYNNRMGISSYTHLINLVPHYHEVQFKELKNTSFWTPKYFYVPPIFMNDVCHKLVLERGTIRYVHLVDSIDTCPKLDALEYAINNWNEKLSSERGDYNLSINLYDTSNEILSKNDNYPSKTSHSIYRSYNKNNIFSGQTAKMIYVNEIYDEVSALELFKQSYPQARANYCSNCGTELTEKSCSGCKINYRYHSDLYNRQRPLTNIDINTFNNMGHYFLDISNRDISNAFDL